MSIIWLHVEDFDIGTVIGPDVEGFAVVVMPNVDHDGTGLRLPAVAHERADRRSCADAFKFRYEMGSVHAVMDTDRRGGGSPPLAA
ncbi:MAG: hypothetical protein WBF93_08995 [Pirellulales bacterium]